MATRPGTSGRSISFGPFEFDPHSGELRKSGMRARLQGQPIALLTLLVERPGEVVTREELQKRLWPADTYVDFEHSLNAAVKRLRAALGDSAQSPRYIETLARRGYRFIAPVTTPLVIAAENQPDPAPPHRHFVLLTSVVAVIAILTVSGMILANVRDASLKRNSPAPIRSLAVLPLVNLSGDREQDFFVDGLTDALRHHLQGIRSLRVISRTSSMYYRGNAKPLPRIARELNIDAAVEGSVLRSGNRVRINVDLAHAATDKRLWSNSYDVELQDVLALQAAVAQKIAGEIRVTLTPPDRERLARVRAVNPDAYQAYSKGRFYWNKRTPDELRKAIGFFQQAIDKDQGYALAYDGLADSWIPLGWYGYLPPSATFPRAKAAVLKALDLDDSLAEAHITLAFVNLYYDRDWTGAEREFRRGIDLNPNYANGHHWYSEFLSLAGRHREGIEEAQRARELDPLSSIINAWVSSRYFYARQYDQAIAEGRNAVELDSNFAPAHLVLGHAYEQKGMLKEAIAEYERASSLAPGSMYTASLAHAYGAAGKRAEAAKVAASLRKQSEREFVSSYDLALAQLALGDKSGAFHLLDAAVEERSPRAAFLGVDPRWDRLRADPRFTTLLKSIGL